MKTDLATSIVAAIAGVVIAYFVCNLLLPDLGNVTFPTLSGDTDYSSIATPDTEVFNFRAINPTVEVYVGQCSEINSAGECLDDIVNTYPTDDASSGGEDGSAN